ncbi:MAG: hypothetical protein AB7U85_09345 [Alphaproteobacteria bacterium]
MIENTWQILSGDDYIKAVQAVNSAFDNERFSIKSSIIQVRELPFYKNFKLLKAIEANAYPRCSMNFLYDNENIIKLDYSAAPITRANKESPIELNLTNLSEYLKFFFSAIRNKEGDNFYFVEKFSDIPLQPNYNDELESELSNILTPVNARVKDDGDFDAKAFIIHQNELILAQLNISRNGFVSVLEENTVMADLPIQKNMLK